MKPVNKEEFRNFTMAMNGPFDKVLDAVIEFTPQFVGTALEVPFRNFLNSIGQFTHEMVEVESAFFEEKSEVES